MAPKLGGYRRSRKRVNVTPRHLPGCGTSLAAARLCSAATVNNMSAAAARGDAIRVEPCSAPYLWLKALR